jgi:hypothetical protein
MPERSPFPRTHVGIQNHANNPERARGHCKVWSRLGLGMKQYRPRDTDSAPASLTIAPCRTPRTRAFSLRLAPHPLVVRPAHLPLATPDRHWIDAFPFAAKLTCPLHPKTNGPDLSIAPVASADIETQDTAALRSMCRTSPLSIAPRGLDPASF